MSDNLSNEGKVQVSLIVRKDNYLKNILPGLKYFFRGLEILWVSGKAFILVPQANELFHLNEPVTVVAWSKNSCTINSVLYN